MVTHLLRYDDFSACSSVAVEEQLVGMFLRHRVPCTFGVIPFICDPQKLVNGGEVQLTPLASSRAEVLKPLIQAGLAEIALHGYAHLALAPVRGYQEFSQRMPLETQRQLIQRGRTHLENVFGVRIRLFVPPWNKLSPATAEVLESEGLLLSSGGPEASDPGDPALGQLPCPTGIEETSRALATAQRFGDGPKSVGTVIHDYDFKESNLHTSHLTLAEFEAHLIRWKSAKQVGQKLISDTISTDRKFEDKKARANIALRKVISGNRLRRKLGARLLDVYWDPKTAGRLAQWLRFIPLIPKFICLH